MTTNNIQSTSNPTNSCSTRNPITLKSILLEGVSGGMSGLCAYSITLPLDVVQTRLQSTVDKERLKRIRSVNLPLKIWPLDKYFQPHLSIRNKYFVVSRDILLKDGWKGFFKGYVPLLIGIVPSRSIYFGTNSHTRILFEDVYGVDRFETSKIALSAVMGSVTASIVTCPLWVTKTHLQLKRELLKHHVTMRDVIKQIYQKQGITGFYRGLTCSFYGSIETMFYWIMYENFKKNIQNWNGNHNREISALDSTKASLLAKTLSILFGYPHEVARTRMRHSTVDVNGRLVYREFWSTLYKIYTQEGFTFLYSGLLFQLFRQVPNATLAVVLFEQFRNAFQRTV